MALPQSFEPIANAVHLSVDMQNLFAPGGIWETPWMERVLPAIVAIAELNPRGRFHPVCDSAASRRQTRPMAALFHQVGMRDPFAIAVLPARDRVTPVSIDSSGHGCRQASLFRVRRIPAYRVPSYQECRYLIITGSETDVCVLATVLDAVDLGFRVIVVEDALCSSFDQGHDALMTLYRNRFSEQIELMTQALVSELWRDPL